MTQHTPGPWYVSDYLDVIGTPYEKEYSRGCIGIITGDNKFIAKYSNGISPANAHLIAAAPDLLEACKLASELLKGVYAPGECEEIDAIDNAIAKAKGQH